MTEMPANLFENLHGSTPYAHVRHRLLDHSSSAMGDYRSHGKFGHSTITRDRRQQT